MKVDIRKLYDFSKAIIKCDDENNPPDQLEKGKLSVKIIIPSAIGRDDVFIIPNQILLYRED